ncbi:MAG TPA: hypothetical protein VLX92_12990 [Kofleriaceae bacterium]|nr:hypothetical protein [Kofleriaceae bacterium]
MLAVVLATACGSPGALPPVRFANALPVAAVNDRRDVPTPPATREFFPSLYYFDGLLARRLPRALELPRAQRALGVSSIDEVPDSTWFTNRIGVRELTADEVRQGPLTADSPELHRPWTVRSTKPGGASVGFTIVDARGIKYLLKFDDKGSPEIETAIDVIVDRLLWAAGYNVAEDQVVYFRDEDLVLAPDATIKAPDGSNGGRLDRKELERRLALIDHGKDGRLRGLVSRWISGKTLGGHPSEGVRADDPNDRIRHELRRDLRGAYTIFAWLDHVDIQEGNFVDSWVTDPADPKRHYVRHFFIDFGRSMSAMALFQTDWRRGHTYLVDFADIARTFFTFGLLDRDWQHRPLDKRPYVGIFDAGTFEPGDWHPDWPSYVPFLTSDRFDKFWGAKIVARFTRAQIEAAVDAGQIHDAAARAYIVDTLVQRQRETIAYWFARVNPLDRFTAAATDAGTRVCFDDLAITNRLADAHATAYDVTAYSARGELLAPRSSVAAYDTGHTCAVVPLALEADGYTIVRVVTARRAFAGETDVHLARTPDSGLPRVIGIWRR